MRYRMGDMLIPRASNKYGTAVWDDTMSDAIEVIPDGDITIVVRTEDDYGWVRVLTRHGVVGFVHRTNLAMAPPVKKRG